MSVVESGRISNSTELSWLHSLPSRMKKIHPKIKVLELPQHYTLIYRCSRAACSINGEIWLKFELIQDCMHTLVTCKNQEDSIEYEGARVGTILYVDFSDTKGQIIP